MSEINQFYVNLQTKKSMESKIELVRRGWPITNNPHGRRPIHNDKSKAAVYEVIPEYKEQAERIYDLYVNQNVATDKIAKMLGMYQTQIRRILFEYSGTEWIQIIRYDGKNEEIITKVPPLLTDEQIERAKARAKSNRQFNARKFQYLLGGRIKCGVCNLTFIGNSSRGKRYYSHSRRWKTEICIKSISLELIEAAVIKSVSELFSSTTNLKMAIENAIGVSRDRKELVSNRIEDCKRELNKLERMKDKLVQSVLDGVFTNSEVNTKMSEIREKSLDQQEQLNTLNDQLKTLMIDVPDDLHLRIQRYYKQLCNEEGSIADWSFNSQQKILDWFFGIGKENGVFIMRNPPDGNIAFNIRGALGSSMLGLMARNYVGSFVAGFDKLDHSFSDNTELVDFRKIIHDLDTDMKTHDCCIMLPLQHISDPSKVRLSDSSPRSLEC